MKQDVCINHNIIKFNIDHMQYQAMLKASELPKEQSRQQERIVSYSPKGWDPKGWDKPPKGWDTLFIVFYDSFPKAGRN